MYYRSLEYTDKKCIVYIIIRDTYIIYNNLELYYFNFK